MEAILIQYRPETWSLVDDSPSEIISDLVFCAKQVTTQACVLWSWLLLSTGQYSSQ